MAKKKKKKANAKLPKTIAGVKVPKELRKAAGQAAKLAEHPVVSDIVAAGLLAAAASLMETKTVAKAAGAVGEGAEDAADEAARNVGRAKAAVSAAAGAMGREIVKTAKATIAGGAKRPAKAE